MYGAKWRKQYADAENDQKLNDLASIDFSEAEDLTVQSYKDDSDINVLMRRFGVTGQLPVAAVQPFYGDFSEAVDYQSALDLIREANASFDALPSEVRRRFGQDPARLMEFLQDPDNRDEAIKLGLIEAPPSVASTPPAPPAPPPAPEEQAAL